MKQDAYLGGVKKGGLTNSTEIRILLCYLIASVSPLNRQVLEDALLGEELVNYFEMAEGLDDLVRQGMATLEGDNYHITDQGRTVASTLASDLPRSVRESACRAVMRAQTWVRKEAQHKAEIIEKDGHYDVFCHIEEMGHDVFSLTFAMPDALSAELVKKQFIARGGEIYAQLVQSMIQTLDGDD